MTDNFEVGDKVMYLGTFLSEYTNEIGTITHNDDPLFCNVRFRGDRCSSTVYRHNIKKIVSNRLVESRKHAT